MEATQACHARFGPPCQTVAIYGERGRNRADMCHVTVPVAFIWELEYMMQWPNLARDLLIWFDSTEAGEMAIEDVTHDATTAVVDRPLMNNFKWRIAWREEDDLLPGEPRTFTSVLVPHAPTPDAHAPAGAIESPAGGGWSAVGVPTEEGGKVRALRNETGGRVEVGPPATDASVALVTVGEHPAHRLVGATELTVDGRTAFQAAEPTTICEGG